MSSEPLAFGHEEMKEKIVGIRALLGDLRGARSGDRLGYLVVVAVRDPVSGACVRFPVVGANGEFGSAEFEEEVGDLCLSATLGVADAYNLMEKYG